MNYYRIKIIIMFQLHIIETILTFSGFHIIIIFNFNLFHDLEIICLIICLFYLFN